jgi:hypothetical protein
MKKRLRPRKDRTFLFRERSEVEEVLVFGALSVYDQTEEMRKHLK